MARVKIIQFFYKSNHTKRNSKMKKSAYTIGSLVILLIAAFIFVLVPIFSGGRTGKRAPAFGKYDGVEIRYEQGSDFANSVTQLADNYKNSGNQLSSQDYYYLFSNAFNSTLTKIAFTKAVEKSGYIVPENAVNRAMMPYFTDETGKYSQRVYRNADPQRVQDLREAFIETLVVNRYQEDLFGSYETLGKESIYGTKTSEAEIKYLQDLNNEERKFNMVSFDMNNYPDSEKATFGKENADKFKKYDFSVITVSEKATAETVSRRIANNEITFSDAISEYSQKSYTNDSGKMNNKYSFQIEGTIKNKDDFSKIQNLKTDEISEPIQTTIGYSIFRADSDAEDADFSDEDTLKIIYNYINSNEASRIEDYFNAQAEKFIASSKNGNFDSASREFNLKKIEIPAFPLNYGNVGAALKLDTSLEGLSGAATNENFLKEAFSLSEGELSKPITNGRNILVLQFTGTENSAEEPAAPEALQDEIDSYDAVSAQTALLSSPKLENNFNNVYFTYFMNGN